MELSTSDQLETTSEDEPEPTVLKPSGVDWVANQLDWLADRLDWVLDQLRTPAAVLAGVIGLYVYVFWRLTWTQQTNYRALAFDTGISRHGLSAPFWVKDP